MGARSARKESGSRSSRPPAERVQRYTSELPILHLEPEVPSSSLWTLTVDGLVAAPSTWTLDELRSMPSEERVWDLSCVWGWTRPACRWEGVPIGPLVDGASPTPGAKYVLARVLEGDYASCLTIEEARMSLLAWRLDGEELAPDHGGPLRLVPPPTKWGYKGVKWVGHLTLLSEFTPGFWEEMVGDARGDIPPEILNQR